MAAQEAEKIDCKIKAKFKGDQGHKHSIVYKGNGLSYESMQELQGGMIGAMVSMGNKRAGIK